MTWNTSKKRNLIRAVLALENADQAERFLRDLLTPNEIEEFSNRLETADMLLRNVPYTTIVAKTGFSSTTVARVSKWLNDGMNGYKLVLVKLHHRPIGQHPSGVR